MATQTVRSCLDMESYSLRNMYLSVFIVETTYLYVGMMLGWTFLLIPRLETSLQTSMWHTAVTSACLPLGMMLGPFTGSVLAPRYGYKSIFVLFSCLSVASVLLLAFRQVFVVCVARIAAGVAIGAVLCYVEPYLQDIAEQEVRTLLNPLGLVFFVAGLYLVYDIGQIISYLKMLVILLAVPLVFSVCLTWLPESPYVFVAAGDLEKAKKSVDFLHRGISTRGLDQLMQLIQEGVRRREAEGEMFLPPYQKEPKAARVALVLFTLLPLTGFPVMFMLMELLVSEVQQKVAVGSSLSAVVRTDLCPIAVAWVLNSHCSPRLKMMISSVVMSASLAALGIFFLNIERGQEASWIPLLCIITYTVAFLMGFVHKHNASEKNSGLRSSGRVVSLTVGFFSMFIVTLLFIPIKEILGTAPVLWTFSAFSVLLTFFVSIYSPEVSFF